MIPKNIHLIFLRKDEPFPELFEKCKQEIQVNHPDWNIRLYNKDDAQDILNQDLPEYIEAYNAFYHNVQKADFLRLALVYLYGGFYMDLDMLSLKPLDELRKYNLVLGEEKILKKRKYFNNKDYEKQFKNPTNYPPNMENKRCTFSS